jgi:hypothetical protein
MIGEEMLAKIIGSSVGTYPNDVAEMLLRNNVIVSAPEYTTNQLVDGVLYGLNQNENFTQEYGSWLEQIITTLNV